MSPNPMGWRPTYANQFQQALKWLVSKGQQIIDGLRAAAKGDEPVEFR